MSHWERPETVDTQLLRKITKRYSKNAHKIKDLPEVYTVRGRNPCTYFKNWDLAQLGSPTMHTLRSPRRLIPSGVFLCTPPNNMSSTPIRKSMKFNKKGVCERVEWTRITVAIYTSPMCANKRKQLHLKQKTCSYKTYLAWPPNVRTHSVRDFRPVWRRFSARRACVKCRLFPPPTGAGLGPFPLRARWHHWENKKIRMSISVFTKRLPCNRM